VIDRKTTQPADGIECVVGRRPWGGGMLLGNGWDLYDEPVSTAARNADYTHLEKVTSYDELASKLFQ